MEDMRVNIENLIEYLEYIKSEVGNIPVKVAYQNGEILDINMVYDKNNIAYIVVDKKENTNIDRIKVVKHIMNNYLLEKEVV